MRLLLPMCDINVAYHGPQLTRGAVFLLLVTHSAHDTSYDGKRWWDPLRDLSALI